MSIKIREVSLFREKESIRVFSLFKALSQIRILCWIGEGPSRGLYVALWNFAKVRWHIQQPPTQCAEPLGGAETSTFYVLHYSLHSIYCSHSVLLNCSILRSTSPFNNIDPSRKLENIITGSEPSITFRDWFCKNTKYDFLALVTVNIGYQIFHWSFIFSLWKESMEVMGWTWKIREKLGTGQIKGGRICSSHLQIRNLGPIQCSH